MFRAELARRAMFLSGLVIVVMSCGLYMWVQRPLRDAAAAELQLAKDVGRLMTIDEILTMSARMAASSRDRRYEDRYNAHVDELDALLQGTLVRSTDPEVLAAARSTDAANLALVDLETRSFALDAAGRHAEALALLEGPDYQQNKSVYAAGMDRAFRRLETVTAERRTLVGRLAWLLQAAGVAGLGMVFAAWTQQRARQLQAVEHAATLEAVVDQRTSELGTRNRAMRLVLDSVQQGLLVVDRRGRMSAERSAMVHRWFGPADGEIRFADYVQSRDPGFASWFDIGFEQVFEGLLPIDLCLAQLPSRLCLGPSTLHVEYQRMMVNGEIDALLVVISDITAILEREQVESEQRDLLRLLEYIERDRAGVVSFLREAHTIVAELDGGGRSSEENARLIHTLKGNAAQYGMTVIARSCQDLEDRAALDADLTVGDRARLVETWRRMAEHIVRIVGVRSQSHLEIRRTEYDKVVELVAAHHDHADILGELTAWRLDPIQARLDRLGDGARVLAERLGKPGLAVTCSGRGLRADNGSWASFWAACVHLVRNAVDHGIEGPDQRIAAGKPPTGALVLEAAIEGAEFVVRVADDGGGIDWQALGHKADRLGLHERAEDLLFAHGLSSSDGANEVSGRGIGMGAVRDEVLRRHGRVVVDSRRGRGTTIELRFPMGSPIAPVVFRSRDATPIGAGLQPGR